MPEAICHPIRKISWNIGVVLVVLLIGCAPVAPPAQALAVTDELDIKWLDVSVGPETVAWFNTRAQPNDIARIDHLNMLNLLGELTTGQRLVVVKSIAEAEQVLESVGEQVDIIGYNLEHGPGNLPMEQADPVGSTRRMRALADQYGVKLAVGPDRAFALSDGVAMAAYADLLILQVQRVQDEPETVRDFILPMVDAVQDAAPDVEIGVQIGAEGDVTGVISLLQSMAKEIDGISILTDHVSTDFLDAFLAEVRPPQPTPQVSAVSPTVSTVLAERERNLVTKSEVATPTLSSQLSPTSVADQPSSQEAKVDQNALSTAATPKIYADAVVVASWLPTLVWAGSMLAGTFIGGLIITAILYIGPWRRVR